jgi:hypothetical protein
MIALEAFDLAEAEGLVCEAQRDRVRESLEPFGDVVGLDEAFDIGFEELSYKEHSNDGSSAVVQVKGTVKLSFLGQHEVQNVDEEHLVVKEGGRWVICDP